MIYVDEFKLWLPRQPRPFHKGSSHLSADTLDELHEMAVKIGMKRSWFQDHPLMPHYDLVWSRRLAALAAGAIYEPLRHRLHALRQQRAVAKGLL